MTFENVPIILNLVSYFQRDTSDAITKKSGFGNPIT